MNFNFGEVLARAWQIAWKHKGLWSAGILVSLLAFMQSIWTLTYLRLSQAGADHDLL